MIPQCRLDSPRPRELNDADEWRSLMKKILSGIIAVVSLSGSTLRADDITRDSQEALRIGAGPRPIPCTSLRAHLQRSTKETVWQRDSLARFKSTFITVDKNVKLEVVDWGGSGRPLVFFGRARKQCSCILPVCTETYRD